MNNCPERPLSQAPSVGCDSDPCISKARTGFMLAALAVVAAGCGSDVPAKDKSEDAQSGEVDNCCDAGNNVGVDSSVGVDGDVNSGDFIPCKVGDGDYCKTQAGTTGKSADCVDAKCVPLYDADPNSAGVCKFEDLANGAGCDDGDKCTLDDQCGEGVCLGEDFECKWDNDPCHKKTCDSKTGECNQPAPAGAKCDDETKCTFGGTCDEDGKCQPGLFIPNTSVSCDDGDVCTQDFCEVGEGCQNIPLGITCENDGNPCNGKEVCDPDVENGCKSINPLPDGTLCTTNTDLCALESWCQAGQCVTKTNQQCNDGDICTVDSCNTFTGLCEYDELYMMKGEACTTNSDPCALESWCQSGKCVTKISKECDDKDPCTQDYCKAGEGCQHEPLDIVCEDDGNPCNGKEICNPLSPTGCQSIASPLDLTLCTANTDLCALESWCQNEKCVTKTSKKCDDGIKCTMDKCNKLTGECSYLEGYYLNKSCAHSISSTTVCGIFTDEDEACDGYSECIDKECVINV